ncbi:MAG: hypothetical protein WA417_21920 [Stellaceae bacterium]|jgi:hypothetical protein
MRIAGSRLAGLGKFDAMARENAPHLLGHHFPVPVDMASAVESIRERWGKPIQMVDKHSLPVLAGKLRY